MNSDTPFDKKKPLSKYCFYERMHHIWNENTEYLFEWKSLAFINIGENKHKLMQKDAFNVFHWLHSLGYTYICLVASLIRIRLFAFIWLQSICRIYLVALFWLHSIGFSQLVAFLWLHSIGCTLMFTFNWLHFIGCTLHSLWYLTHCLVCFCYRT